MALAYTEETMKAWANNVAGLLDGSNGQTSIKSCSVNFCNKVNEMIEMKLWSGAAAKTNYQNFIDVNNGLINFVNKFGQSFSEAMNSLSAQMNNLEQQNLGSVNVGEFGSVSYDAISSLEQLTVGTNVVRYDAAQLYNIASQLNGIKGNLDEVVQRIKTEINKINDGSEMWDGNSAATAHDSLLSVVDSSYSEISENLQRCIDNLNAAAQNAESADK